MPTGSLVKDTGSKPRERKDSKRQGNGYEFEHSIGQTQKITKIRIQGPIFI